MPDTGPYGQRATLGVRALGLGVVALAATASAGCAGAVDIEPAPGGGTVECRDLVAALPPTLADLARRGADTTVGVAAWGDPAVVLRCGTEPLGPTTLPCVTIDGVDWIVVAQDENGAARLATFGRDPAVEVEVPAEYAPAPLVLTGLGEAVDALPVDRSCV